MRANGASTDGPNWRFDPAVARRQTVPAPVKTISVPPLSLAVPPSLHVSVVAYSWQLVESSYSSSYTPPCSITHTFRSAYGLVAAAEIEALPAATRVVLPA